MTPQDSRKKRLEHDYTEMCNIRGNIVQWKSLKGSPPFVEEYEITVNIKGIIGEAPKYRDQHIIKISLPANYPVAAPDTRMISSPKIYHPNWYKDGKWCFGTWIMSEGLGHHIIRMIRTLQYDMEITNEHSPANNDANGWYLSNRDRGIFPCDYSNLPDPSYKKLSINNVPKKKFVIN